MGDRPSARQASQRLREYATFGDLARQISWRRGATTYERRRGSHGGFWPLWLRMRGTPPRESDGDFAAILLVHGRVATLDLQVRIALHTPSIGTVHVSNNNPDVDVERHLTVNSPRVVLHEELDWNQTRRFMLASRLPEDRFVCLDDDIYLEPDVLDGLLGEFRQDPSVPLGVTGQAYRLGAWINEVNRAGPVDILNRLYVVSAEHARRLIVLMDEMGWTDTERRSNFADDVLISQTGAGPARVVATPWIDCTSHNRESVSTFRRAGFHNPRGPWLEEAREVQARLGWA